MTIYLRATRKAGLSPPWKYVRAKLAEHWGIVPPMVDELPVDEINLQLQLWSIEAACQPPPRPSGQR